MLLSVATTDLVAHWTFDEAAGAVASDTSPNGVDNSGSLIGGATWSPGNGQFSGAIYLDGSGDYIDVPNSGDINTGTHDKRTVAVWFKADNAALGSRRQVIFEEGAGTRGLTIYVYNQRLYVGGWNRAEAWWAGNWMSTDAIASNQWHHVALVLDGTDTVQPDAFKAYLDGAEFGSSEGCQLWSHSGDINIGYSSDAVTHDGGTLGGFAGMLDDMRIYNRALSPVEIDELANTAPAANDNTYVTNEDIAFDGQCTATDEQGDTLAYAIAFPPMKGTITNFDTATGEFTYTPNANVSGTDYIAFTAFDGFEYSAWGTITVTINAVNDAPAASDAAVGLDEDGSFSGAVNASDVDAGAVLTYAVVTPPANGTITAFDANTGDFTYEPDPNFNGVDTFTFRANDGMADSNTATVTLTVAAVNDAPTAADDAFSVAEDNAYTGSLTAADIDIGDTLAYSIVTAPANGTITAFDPATGDFTYEGAADYNGADSFTFRVNDGSADSNVATVTITVTAVNDAPIATPAAIAVDEDGSYSGAVAGTDVDAAETLTYAMVTAPSNGTITAFDPATGDFTYEPDANYNGADSFTFRANDGDVDSAPATVAVTVNAVNDVPTAADDAFTVDEDNDYDGLLPAADIDVGDTLTYTIVVGPTHGTITAFDPATGEFTYLPDLNYNGPDSFTFRVNDGTADSNVATISMTVLPGNDPPVAAGDALATDEDNAVSGTLSATDIDVGDTVTYAIVTAPTKGAITAFDANTGDFTYTPDANVNGADSFTFRASDGTLSSNTATVSLTVAAVNDAPTADDDAFTMDEDTVYNGAVTGADVDTGDTIAYAIVTPPTNGTITAFDADTGAFTYAPDANFNGADSFTFRINDGTVDSALATISITVQNVNDAPTASADAFVLDEDGSHIGSLSADDIDTGDTLTYSIVTAPANGTITAFDPATGDFTYKGDADYNGADSFTFRVNDGTTDSNTATVAITINAVNDAPIAADDTATLNEDGSLAGVLTATDVDAGDTLTCAIVAGPANGTLTAFNPATGAFTYAPNANFNGADSFTFLSNDGSADSNVATISLTVNAVNDAPAADAAAIAVNEDGSFSGSVTGADVDAGDTLTFAVVTAPVNGTLTAFDANTGGFTYEPGPNYNGADSFTFRVNDGTANSNVATVTVTVNSVNDAPVADDAAAVVDEDGSVNGNVDANDIDGDAISFAVVTPPANGTLTAFDADTGAFTYVPNANFNGADSFVFRANDGTTNSNAATVSITVNSVNDAPIAASDAITVVEDGSISDVMAASDVDVGDTLTFALVTGPSHGSLTAFDSDTGAFTYVPDADYNGADSFSFRATDGSADSNTAVVSITVQPTNDTPVSSDSSLSVTEDNSVSGRLYALDADTGDTLTYVLVTHPAHGTITAFDPVAGTITYTPDADYHGPDSVTFRVSDGLADSNVATVSIAVQAVNDVPDALPWTHTVDEDQTLAGMAMAEDVDGDVLSFQLVTQPAHGQITSFDTVTGAFTYAPDPDFAGADGFTFRATDGQATSAEAAVTMIVVGVNDAPTAFDASISLGAGGNAVGVLTADDRDGDTLAYSIAVGPVHGSITSFDAATGAFTYSPATEYAGADSFSFRVTDGMDESGTAVVSITGQPTNDAPVAQDIALTLVEDSSAGGLLRGYDAEGDALTFAILTQPSHGTITSFDATTGAYVYVPAVDYEGADIFTFRVSDGEAWSESAAVGIAVSPANDAPIARDGAYSLAEDGSVQGALDADDIDAGDTLTFSILSAPTHGELTALDPAVGTFMYKPHADYSGADAFTFAVSDGQAVASGTIALDVQPANDVPVAQDASVGVDEDGSLTGILAGRDADTGDALTFELVEQPAHGVIAEFDALTGAYTYVPDADYHGSDSFRFRVRDGLANSAPAVVTVAVHGVNDAPTTQGRSFVLDEDGRLRGRLTGADIDGDALVFELVTGPTHGRLTGFDVTTGEFTYVPNDNYHGNDSFSFRVRDGQGCSETAVVSLNVRTVADAAQIYMPAGQTSHGVTRFGKRIGNAIHLSDADGSGDVLRVTLTATRGRITLPTTDGLTFEVGDGKGDRSMTFTGSVAGINTALDGLALRSGRSTELNVSTEDASGDGADDTGATDSVEVDVEPQHDPQPEVPVEASAEANGDGAPSNSQKNTEPAQARGEPGQVGEEAPPDASSSDDKEEEENERGIQRTFVAVLGPNTAWNTSRTFTEGENTTARGIGQTSDEEEAGSQQSGEGFETVVGDGDKPGNTALQTDGESASDSAEAAAERAGMDNASIGRPGVNKSAGDDQSHGEAEEADQPANAEADETDASGTSQPTSLWTALTQRWWAVAAPLLLLNHLTHPNPGAHDNARRPRRSPARKR